MPKVAEFAGIAIYVYFRDHNPPHFHAREAADEALITIRDLQILAGSISSGRNVLAWAEVNRATLIAAWNACNPHNLY